MANGSSIAEHAELLAHVELFSGLSRVTLAKLAAHLVPVNLAGGAELFHQGEPGDAFYLIARGDIGVYVARDADEGETRVALLGAGDPVGEMALLTNAPRSATIRAETDGELLRGVRYFPGGSRTSSIAMDCRQGTVHFIDTVHREPGSKFWVRRD